MLSNNHLNLNLNNFKLITKKNYIYSYLYIHTFLFFCFIFYRFFKKFLFKFFENHCVLLKINKKKNLFFKKKLKVKTLISKRLSVVLKKRKKFRLIRFKKPDRGNFFFKKFFFKTLIKSRNFLKHFFFLTKRERQSKITKTINVTKNNYLFKNCVYEYTLLNLVLRSHICLFVSDALKLIKNNFVYINGRLVTDYNLIISEGDCIQFKTHTLLYKYILFSKKILKKKLSFFRLNSWKFFKQKFFKQKQQLKTKKRKTPKYIFLFYLFKLDIPKFLEVDYLTLSIYFLKKLDSFKNSTYYLNKLFSFKLFSLYNFKKIN